MGALSGLRSATALSGANLYGLNTNGIPLKIATPNANEWALHMNYDSL